MVQRIGRALGGRIGRIRTDESPWTPELPALRAGHSKVRVGTIDAVMDDLARERMCRRLLLAFKLHEDGVSMMRQNLRRRYPDETDTEVNIRLQAWLHRRPGAEHGDAVGRSVEWPRPSR